MALEHQRKVGTRRNLSIVRTLLSIYPMPGESSPRASTGRLWMRQASPAHARCGVAALARCGDLCFYGAAALLRLALYPLMITL